jgi:hypothetical protein
MGVLVVAGIAGACASSLKVRDLLGDPGRYNGRTVQLHGVVTRGGPVLSGAYQLSDNTGSILVVVGESVPPRQGTSLKVQGTFRSSFSWGGQQVAAVVVRR